MLQYPIIRFSTSLGFSALGIAHLAGMSRIVEAYDALGAGQQLRWLAGAAYFSGGMALIFKRSRQIAALALGATMCAVVLVDVLVIGAPPWPAVILLAGCAMVFRSGVPMRTEAAHGRASTNDA